MQESKIEWIFNPDGSRPGYTSNPIKGLCPIGCSYCYARRLYNRFKWDTKIRFDVEELLAIEHHKKPVGIFLGSTFELFWDGLEQFIMEDYILPTIEACPQHRFYLLTKCPQNLIKFSPFPNNCWVGVTATNYYSMFKALNGLAYLDGGIQARVKFISFEPLLESVAGPRLNLSGTNWVIIGAQTKPYKPPKISWVEAIVRAADKAGIPVFLKDNLMPLFDYPQPPFFRKPSPCDTLKLRQEMPEGGKP